MGCRTAVVLGLLGFVAPDGAGHLAFARASCGFHRGALTHGDRASRQIALTFDLCPTSRRPGYASEIVALLKERRIPATVFISGAWATAHRAPLRELAETGTFELALHGDRHRHLAHLSELAIVDEIESGRRTLERLGVTPVALFRPPYGETPRALAAAAERARVSVILWDVVSGDPIATSRPRGSCVRSAGPGMAASSSCTPMARASGTRAICHRSWIRSRARATSS